ncbi:MAG: hypothetical protein R2753_06305 [Chitinophagales bacterium]
MNLRQENIIKDKLLEYEVPFEEKYWEDFQKRQGIAKKSRSKYYGLLFIALLSVPLFLVLKNDQPKGTLADSNIDSIVSSFEVDNSNVLSEDQSIIRSRRDNTVNSAISNQPIYNRSDRKQVNKATNTSFDMDKPITSSSKNSVSNAISSTNTSSANVYSSSSKNGSADWNNSNQSAINNGATTADHSAVNGNVLKNASVDKSNSSSNITTFINNDHGGNNFIPTNIKDNSIINGRISNQSVADASNNNQLSQIDEIIDSKMDYLEKRTNEITKSINALVALEKISFLPPNNPHEDAKSKNGEVKQSDDIDWEAKKQKNWEIRIQAGLGLSIPIENGKDKIENPLINEVTGGGPNLTIGLTYVYQLNSKVSIETGLVYKKISNVFAAESVWRDDNQGIIIDEVSIVEKLNSFELPIGVNVKMTSWLYFSGGFSLAYVRPTNITFPEAVVTNIYNLPQQEIESYKVLANISNYGISRMDVRAYAGLTFNVSSFVAFRMIINQGLIDRTNSTYYNKVDYDVHTDYTFSAIIRLNPRVLK